jgi:branched-chain amino acid transport system substrate-binding protein
MKKIFPAVAVVAAASVFGLSGALATSSATPGVTSKTVKIGATFPLSGPASSYAPIARGMSAYFAYINSRKGKDGKRGVYGRQVSFTVLDDGYNPANTVQLTRQLVEQNGVFALVGGLGTEPQTAVRDYLNQSKVPQLFVSTGATTWGKDYKKYPWTIGWQPDYQAEGKAYARYINTHNADAKIAIIYQNDDYGKDYIAGFKAALKNKAQIVGEEGYEVTSATVASQVAKLKASKADTFVILATPKFTIQSLVIAYKLGWSPALFVNSVGAADYYLTLATGAAGSPAAVNGVITDNYILDPGDPTQRKLAGMKLYFRLMGKYAASNANIQDINYLYGMAKAHTFITALYQAGKNPTRASIMRAAIHLNESNPFVLPKVKVRTTPSMHFPICKMQLYRYGSGHYSSISGLLQGC